LPRLDARGHRERLVDVARPDARHQTVLTAVRQFDRLLELVELDDGEHRTENLFLRDAHLRRDAIEKRRRVVEAAAERRTRRPLPARGNRGALASADFHVALDRLELPLRDDRT